MDILVISAMLFAALLHASWHALIKNHGDRLVGLAGMNVISTSVVLCILPFVPVPHAAAWPFLWASVPFHMAYKFGLARIYGYGDLGQVFPVARGAVPILASVLAFVLAHEVPSQMEVVAICLVSLGVFMIAREKCAVPLSRKAVLIGLFTGLMVASYSVLNGMGARANGDWLGFSVWLLLLDGGFFTTFVWFLRGNALVDTLKQNAAVTLVSGLLGTGAYLVFLWALSHSAIGSVSALRETSILFASIIGVFVLKEKFSSLRMIAAVIVTLGVVLFGFAN